MFYVLSIEQFGKDVMGIFAYCDPHHHFDCIIIKWDTGVDCILLNLRLKYNTISTRYFFYVSFRHKGKIKMFALDRSMLYIFCFRLTINKLKIKYYIRVN